MNNRIAHWLAAVVVLLTLPVPGSSATVSIQPSSSSALIGQTISLAVSIDSAVGIAGYGFDVSFTPGVLELTSVTPGNLFAPSDSVVFLPAINNAGGSATGFAESIVGPGSFTGSGSLLTLVFRALAGGSSSVTLADLLVVDANGEPLDVGTANAAVNVSNVPEPGTMWVSGLILGVAQFRRLRSRG